MYVCFIKHRVKQVLRGNVLDGIYADIKYDGVDDNEIVADKLNKGPCRVEARLLQYKNADEHEVRVENEQRIECDAEYDDGPPFYVIHHLPIVHFGGKYLFVIKHD